MTESLVVRTAKMNAKKKNTGLVIGAAVVAALALVGTARGNGNGGGGGGTGSAIPGGALGTVTLSQDVTKGVTDSFRVDARITFGTRDFHGNPIPWPYKVSWVLVNDKTYTIISTTGFESGIAGFAPGTSNHFTTFTPINKVVAGDRLRVDLILEASPTDGKGRPLFPQWKSVAGAVSTNRVLIGTPPPVTPQRPAPPPEVLAIFPNFQRLLDAIRNSVLCCYDTTPTADLRQNIDLANRRADATIRDVSTVINSKVNVINNDIRHFCRTCDPKWAPSKCQIFIDNCVLSRAELTRLQRWIPTMVQLFDSEAQVAIEVMTAAIIANTTG